MTLRVLVDSREKRPYDFAGYGCTCEKSGLKIGDYSVAGLEDSLAIERKALDDLIACTIDSRSRFVRELVKARGLKCFAVVVEASLQAVASGQYRSAIKPHAVLQSIFSMQVKYGVPFVFAGDRHAGEYVTFSLLEKYAKSVVAAGADLVAAQPVLASGGRVDLHRPRPKNSNFAFDV